MKQASLALLALALISTSALAQHRGEHREGFRFEFGDRDRDFRTFRREAPFEDRDFVSREHHWWRGRWWEYGLGPCWRLTPYGNYVWICE